jgi:hypothetical protein
MNALHEAQRALAVGVAFEARAGVPTRIIASGNGMNG